MTRIPGTRQSGGATARPGPLYHISSWAVSRAGGVGAYNCGPRRRRVLTRVLFRWRFGWAVMGRAGRAALHVTWVLAGRFRRRADGQLRCKVRLHHSRLACGRGAGKDSKEGSWGTRPGCTTTLCSELVRRGRRPRRWAGGQWRRKSTRDLDSGVHSGQVVHLHFVS